MTKAHFICYLALLSVACLFFLTTSAFAQDKCATVPFNNKPGKQNAAAFESWIMQKMQRQSKALSGRLQAEEVYTIPVVVHIIHNGENEGTGSNISLEQVRSQIAVLNADFRRRNPDTLQTPNEFLPVAADPSIEFVLAKQDPDGFPTNGVVRAKGTQRTYAQEDASLLSDLSYWNSNEYFNIWVTNLTGDYLGFASYPVTDLPGIDYIDNASTDGIVVDYQYFGSAAYGVTENAGRTTTHEIGHFLGLRHIWGDGGCEVDDYVEDTPLQGSQTDGCPAEKTTCGNVNMFQNYMDYTSDVCMNIFTKEQKARMRIVLENSIRRNSLLTSPAKEEPVPLANDISISRIIAPARSICNEVFIPAITILNVGDELLQSASINVLLNDQLIEQKTFDVALATGEAQQVAFSPVDTRQVAGNAPSYKITYTVDKANGSEDENVRNNSQSMEYVVPKEGTLPLTETFEDTTTLLNDAIVLNEDNGITWQLIAVPGYGDNNQALYLRSYNYDIAGATDILFTPTYNFSELTSATLQFRYAYAAYIDNGRPKQDGLAVGISLDCGATIDTLLFDERGENLSTKAGINKEFTPADRRDWRTITLSLEDYAGQPNVQVAFIGSNDYGNNIYLDDISIMPIVALDAAIGRIISPGRITASKTPSPAFTVQNEGTTTLYSFDVSYQLDTQAGNSFAYNAFPIPTGEGTDFPLEAPTLAPGLHTLSLSVTNPNAAQDQLPDNNAEDYTFYIDNQQDILPLLLDFEQQDIPDVLNGEAPTNQQEWLVANPDDDITWDTVAVERDGKRNKVAVIRNFNNVNTGSTDQLVSPLLDFRYLREASVFFDVSYGLFSEEFSDTLRVLISLDSGQTYNPIYTLSGDEMSAVPQTDSAWVPTQPGDWKRLFVDLSEYTGKAGVRLAFEAKNGYGNHIYLDNIEFFQSADRTPVALNENTFRLYPNPSADGRLQVVFNLQAREDVQLLIYNIGGALIWQRTFPNTLNQTYDIDLAGNAAGVYLMRSISPSIRNTQRFIIY